ncbi:Uncharacterized protein APZ42_011442 [Daphnia magna]|uniref:Uncharacterized protein n=1 Tax=Daphnia magna TaxID=35525 RepID=A0A162CZ76_9CRUS|nr:Uncharacterized protein APZ42_011442 [Daphnia magna]
MEAIRDFIKPIGALFLISRRLPAAHRSAFVTQEITSKPIADKIIGLACLRAFRGSFLVFKSMEKPHVTYADMMRHITRVSSVPCCAL